MRSLIFPACLVAAAIGAWNLWSERAQSQPPGILVADAPRQKNLVKPVELARGDYRLVAKAEFDITARVILRMRYRFDDMAAVSPVDFALGWGAMSDTAVLEKISCSQGSRYYACSWQSADIIEPGRFTVSSANMHLIPQSPAVEDALLRVRKGQVVTLRGLLVDVLAPDGRRWSTSMTREDSGPGGCEIVLVTEVIAS